jgi:response regulator RpfG family c-di-GMP phosphodiesterase
MSNHENEKAIVCVDDEKMILNSLQSMLSRNLGSDYIYEFAESAEEAIEVIGELSKEGYKLEAVISDWLMPGMKGDEFLSKVHEKYPEITKVLLTGHVDSKVVKRLEEDNHEGIHCIFKPWKDGNIIEVIKHEDTHK